MDLLAAIASDPLSLPLWAVLLFAAGMYPVGMLFGCSPCCGCRLCCRDNVEQVVVDWGLAGGYDAVVLRSPFTVTDNSTLFVQTTTIDTADNNAVTRKPTLIAVGQTSGAKCFLVEELVLDSVDLGGLPIVTSGALFRVRTKTYEGQQVAYPFAYHGVAAERDINAVTLEPDGGAALVGFTDGEAVTVYGIGTTTVEAAQATVQLYADSCQRQRPRFVVTNQGKYHKNVSANVSVSCLADEGSVVFDMDDVIAETLPCDKCFISFGRSTSHPLSYTFGGSTPSYGVLASNVQTNGHSAFEFSWLGVAVNLCRKHPISCDGASVTVQTKSGWSAAVAAHGGLHKECECTTSATLSPELQDCLPLANWPTTTTCTGASGVLLPITLSATSPWGSGFAGTASAPDGLIGVDDGPISAVAITSPGSGYAIPGRAAPTLSLDAAIGTGASLTATLEQFAGDNGVPLWRIASVSVVDGGEGYADSSAVTATVDSPGVEVTAASLTLLTEYFEPTLTPEIAGGGSGAALSITYEPVELTYLGFTYNVWRIASVSVVNGGSGYTDGSDVEFTLGTNDVSNGSVTGTVQVTGGVIQSVTLPGSASDVLFAKDNGTIGYVHVNSGGSYYEEDASLPGIAAAVTIHIQQTQPSNGSGASIQATVDTDQDSATFGKITALTLASGGDGYLAASSTACTGPGGLYSANVGIENFGDGVVTLDEWLTRACQNYTVEVTLQ